MLRHLPTRTFVITSTWTAQTETPTTTETRRGPPYGLKPTPHSADSAAMQILVADDDPSVRRLLELQLVMEGHEVMTVGDGVSALDAVDASTPDLLVLDVMMPELNGWEVLERLRADDRHRDLPVVLVTARDLPDDRERARELRAVAVHAKPHDAERLLETINAVAFMRRSRA